jgi:hypothetical protein
MEALARIREELDAARLHEQALRETLRAVLDAVDTDHQPISRDELTVVRPAWLLKVREAACNARPLTCPDEARRLADARGHYLDAALWWESCARAPAESRKGDALERARLDKNVAYEALLAVVRRTAGSAPE